MFTNSTEAKVNHFHALLDIKRRGHIGPKCIYIKLKILPHFLMVLISAYEMSQSQNTSRLTVPFFFWTFRGQLGLELFL